MPPPAARSSVPLEVLYHTGSDPRHPPALMVDGGERSFWVTTGMFPQEVLLGLKGPSAAAPATVAKVRTWSHHIRRLVVDKCVEAQPTKFERLLEVELTDKGGALQIESFGINPGAGANIRYLRLHIASGWDDFASIHNIIVEGDS
eukprot:TRINITY_DN6150_c0_g1_i1.p3 TRINITY_DN6150_c0_g1~~TRINITY_DN6150_c0_g1_i1.p3  ORF type:complete len:146 (+),score=53.85 TRINITY_DN6150_c0_g1_i1:91-528(+)